MGSRELRVIHVPRRVTVLLLLLVSVTMAAVVWFLSGKAVYREEASLEHLLRAVLHYDRTGAGRANVLASASFSFPGACWRSWPSIVLTADG